MHRCTWSPQAQKLHLFRPPNVQPASRKAMAGGAYALAHLDDLNLEANQMMKIEACKRALRHGSAKRAELSEGPGCHTFAPIHVSRAVCVEDGVVMFVLLNLGGGWKAAGLCGFREPITLHSMNLGQQVLSTRDTWQNLLTTSTS